MAKLKDKKAPDIIDTKQIKPLPHISFNLKYLTTNKSYCFKTLKGDVRKSEKAFSELFVKLCNISELTLDDAKARGKIQGCEPIPYFQFSKSFQQVMDGIDVISKDSTLSVFRFCQNDYRIICKTDVQHSNLLYIIGFDFDYSAYDHG